MSGIKSGSKVKSNPYGPDWAGSEQAPTQDAIFDLISNFSTSTLPYAQFPKRILINADSSFEIKSDAGARVFHADLSSGFEVIGSISVLSPGALKIGAGSSAIVSGV